MKEETVSETPEATETMSDNESSHEEDMRIGFSPFVEEYGPEDIPTVEFNHWKQETPPPLEESFDHFFTFETGSPSSSFSFGNTDQTFPSPFRVLNVTDEECQDIYRVYREIVW